MNLFIAWLVIPVLTILVSGPSDWFSINFSVIGSKHPQNLLLLSWAIVIGIFYRMEIQRIIKKTTYVLNINTKPTLAMVDCSAFLLITAVFLPYKPLEQPFISTLHLTMAFSASVLFFISITLADLKLYAVEPIMFSLPTKLLVLAICITLWLLALCDFLITSALEIFLTLFSCFWIRLFHKRVEICIRKKHMSTRI